MLQRYLDPKVDLAFKRVFGEHAHLLKSFLNALLPLPEDGRGRPEAAHLARGASGTSPANGGSRNISPNDR